MNDDVCSRIPELKLLKEWEDSLGGQRFTDFVDSFGIGVHNGLREWFDGEAPDAYLERLIPFAEATSSGSFYALWRCDDRTDLATLPVVFFGDEGGLDLKAGNLRELFQLLAAEPEEPDFRDEDERHPEDEDEERREFAELTSAHHRYVAWLDEQFGLAPFDTDNGEGVDYTALIAYTREFACWIAEFASPELLAALLDELYPEFGLFEIEDLLASVAEGSTTLWDSLSAG